MVPPSSLFTFRREKVIDDVIKKPRMRHILENVREEEEREGIFIRRSLTHDQEFCPNGHQQEIHHWFTHVMGNHVLDLESKHLVNIGKLLKLKIIGS